jgi:hypothetical protein
MQPLTYIDAFRYVLPGTFLVLLSVPALWIAGRLTPAAQLVSGFGSSILLLLAIFLAGVLIQVIGRVSLQRVVRQAFWQSRHPQELGLVRDGLLDEVTRQQVVLAMQKRGLLTAGDVVALDSPLPRDERRQAARRAFTRVYSLLTTGDLEESLVADAYYNLYIGCATASLIGFLGYIQACHLGFGVSRTLLPGLSGHRLSFVLGCSLLVSTFLLMGSARRVAEKSVYEVFLAFLALTDRQAVGLAEALPLSADTG